MKEDYSFIDYLFDELYTDKKGQSTGETKVSKKGKESRNDKETILTYEITGIKKEDLSVCRKTEKGQTYIVIEGKTKDRFTGTLHQVNVKFLIDTTKVDFEGITCTAENGLLYVILPNKDTIETNEILEIL